MTDFFPGFETRRIATRETEIHCVTGGSGPPLLLLHGYPQTHVMWHRAAPMLAQHFTVVAADLRGYGDSGKPGSDDSHAAYSKRVMAGDLAEVMSSLGFDRFFVAAHDRGARVAHRMALDFPDRIDRLATLDIVPTHYRFGSVNKDVATRGYHWFFLIQPAPFPETLIGGSTAYFLNHTLDSWSETPGVPEPEARADYLRCLSDPEMIHATCEDYRAAATIDLEHDEADFRAGNRVRCPMLVLWGAASVQGSTYDMTTVWRNYADDVRGRPVDCGHFIAEEAPGETAETLSAFFSERI
ncbi:MAG: alpha/beta hydrolase [Gammaproteobacteria bacterium]|nr:alpha/beta hydrolase [Gammaproteobacteria bacterium]